MVAHYSNLTDALGISIAEGEAAIFDPQDDGESEPELIARVIDEIPLGRMGNAEEVAAAVLWLCSPGAGFMIGQIVAPDGG